MRKRGISLFFKVIAMCNIHHNNLMRFVLKKLIHLKSTNEEF